MWTVDIILYCLVLVGLLAMWVRTKRKNKWERKVYAEFCREMLAWVEQGCPHAGGLDYFRSNCGVCYNLKSWCYRKGYGHTPIDNYRRTVMGGKTYPFNRNSVVLYTQEQFNRTLYMNRQRIDHLIKHSK